MLTIHMIEEGQAHGQIKEIFRDIEGALGAPFVPAIFRSFAMRPELLEEAWPQIKRNIETQSFVELSARLRRRSDSIVETIFEFDDLYSWIQEHGFSREDLRRMRYALEMLHYVGPKLLLVTASLYVSLHNIRDPKVVRAKALPQTNQEPEFPTKVPRMMMNQATADVKEAYLDVAEAVGAPILPDEFQMLGEWPPLLRRVWNDLRPVMHSKTFLDEAECMLAVATEAAQELPYSISLEHAGIDVRRVVDMFMSVYSKTQLAISAVRWMITEGERISRMTGRAAGESQWF